MMNWLLAVMNGSLMRNWGYAGGDGTDDETEEQDGEEDEEDEEHEEDSEAEEDGRDEEND